MTAIDRPAVDRDTGTGRATDRPASDRRAADSDAIDQLLPQTQCTRCGYAGCKPYAEAIAAGAAAINQCPPGGAATIARLADLLGRAPLPLNPANGVEGPPLVAQIDEERCIGCAKCLPPCPVDAIVGMRKRMHTVLADLCTGCELCVAPCPVDCIAMVSRAQLRKASSEPAAHDNRARFEAHNARIERRARAQAQLLSERKHAVPGSR